MCDTAIATQRVSDGILDTVLERFQTESRMWVSHIKVYARNLFFALVIISMVWNFGQMVFRYANIAEFFSELIRFLVFTGLFLWFLENAPLMSEAPSRHQMQDDHEQGEQNRRFAQLFV